MVAIQGSEIDTKWFWKKRLDDAKKAGHIQYSVFLANDAHWEKLYRAHVKVLEKLIDQSKDKVLDAGCGYGRLAPLFANYTGIDFAPCFVEEAERLYPAKRFMEADLRKLPFKDKEFDWGLLVSVKHMIIGNMGIDAWMPMENEMRRVCKKVIVLEYGEMESKDDSNESIAKYEIL